MKTLTDIKITKKLWRKIFIKKIKVGHTQELCPWSREVIKVKCLPVEIYLCEIFTRPGQEIPEFSVYSLGPLKNIRKSRMLMYIRNKCQLRLFQECETNVQFADWVIRLVIRAQIHYIADALRVLLNNFLDHFFFWNMQLGGLRKDKKKKNK